MECSVNSSGGQRNMSIQPCWEQSRDLQQNISFPSIDSAACRSSPWLCQSKQTKWAKVPRPGQPRSLGAVASGAGGLSGSASWAEGGARPQLGVSQRCHSWLQTRCAVLLLLCLHSLLTHQRLVLPLLPERLFSDSAFWSLAREKKNKQQDSTPHAPLPHKIDQLFKLKKVCFSISNFI